MIEKDRKFLSVLKTTTMIGGSSFISIFIGMLKTKFAAVLIGPGGIGLLGIFNSMVSMVSTITGLGLATSGTRYITNAAVKNDEESFEKAKNIINRMAFFIGALSFVFMLIGSQWLSVLSFGNNYHTFSIAILGITLFVNHQYTAKCCILQGIRKIKEIAKITIISSFLNLFINVFIYYFWKLDGIVPGLVIGSLGTYLLSWWYARDKRSGKIRIIWKEYKQEIFYLSRSGFPLMVSSLVITLNPFIINAFLMRTTGMTGVGLYQAAYALSGVMINFILNAMSTDYYPRLIAVANEKEALKREVEIQTEVALLFAVPAIALSIILIPQALDLFYSSDFRSAESIFKWMIFGILGRVVSWPLSYVILAKGMGKLFLFSEVITGLVNIGLLVVCFHYWGLSGTGIGFALMYVFYTLFIIYLVYKYCHIVWSKKIIFRIIKCTLFLTLMAILENTSVNEIIKKIIEVMIILFFTGSSINKLKSDMGLKITDFLRRPKTNVPSND